MATTTSWACSFATRPGSRTSAVPTQPVAGVVRDADTKEPIAGVTLYCHRRAGTKIHGHYPPETVTGDDGRYELASLPNGPDNAVAVVPPAGSPYVPQMIEMDTSHGLAPCALDVDVKRGVLIRGRVTDGATGEPVPEARIEYFVFTSNSHIDQYPGIRHADDIVTETGADGRYQLVGLPGAG